MSWNNPEVIQLAYIHVLGSFWNAELPLSYSWIKTESINLAIAFGLSTVQLYDIIDVNIRSEIEIAGS